MTLKEREDRFIMRQRENGEPMTWETEILLRWGFRHGAEELAAAAFEAGIEHQQDTVLLALGAMGAKGRVGTP